MTACNAWVEKYVGKGLERVKHSGQCPLDLGHDGDHVPPGMLNTGFTQVPTDQLDEAKALAKKLVADYKPFEEPEPAQLTRLYDIVLGWQ